MNKNKKNIRVLILDDDKFMLEFVSHLFRELGVGEVLVAEDGKAGLYVLSAQIDPIDLLLCDVEMPGMDGIEFLRNIADQKYTGKIVLFSGVDADLLKAIERLAIVRGLDVIGILSKPVTIESLTVVLKKLFLPVSRIVYPSTQLKHVFDAEEVKRALVADQIKIFFQPKISASSRRVTSVECLARLHHPKYGDVSPDNFISIVEQNGLINDFTRTVLKKVRAAARCVVAAGVRLENFCECFDGKFRSIQSAGNLSRSRAEFQRADRPRYLGDNRRQAGKRFRPESGYLDAYPAEGVRIVNR